MSRSYIVTFAGVPGSSKSIVAHHLSLVFGLPIFSTDNLRFEVKEDLRISNITLPEGQAEFEKRRAERWQALLAGQQPFILDASVDRRWPEIRHDLAGAGYAWFLVSIDLSKPFIRQLFLDTARPKALEKLPNYMRQHDDFLRHHQQDVALSIGDTAFPRRRTLAEQALRKFLKAV